MTLLDVKIGNYYIVEALKLEKATEMRLESLGLTEGTTITIQNNKKSGSVIFIVRGTRLAIGKEIAKSILVREAA